MLRILKDGVFDDVALALQFGVAKADADERIRIRPMPFAVIPALSRSKLRSLMREPSFQEFNVTSKP